MTELKTLKDLQKDLEWNFTTYNILRQEAIKWIKMLDEYYTYDEIHKIGDLLEFFTGVNNGYTSAELVSWIKHFFNLTEEELK